MEETGSSVTYYVWGGNHLVTRYWSGLLWKKRALFLQKNSLFLQKRHTCVAYIVECAMLHMSFGMYAHINEVFMLHMDAAHMIRT
mmetsp:Transcript_69018/g.101117  ORF Transcript_69018/g.101117 Transcript_69018/m.101117 type:complete len:85 (-) Transcript_69018:56-310(-)